MASFRRHQLTRIPLMAHASGRCRLAASGWNFVARWIAGSLASLLLIGCRDPFPCGEKRDGVILTCDGDDEVCICGDEESRRCATPDSTCAGSGYRYVHAAGGKGERCVDASLDPADVLPQQLLPEAARVCYELRPQSECGIERNGTRLDCSAYGSESVCDCTTNRCVSPTDDGCSWRFADTNECASSEPDLPYATTGLCSEPGRCGVPHGEAGKPLAVDSCQAGALCLCTYASEDEAAFEAPYACAAAVPQSCCVSGLRFQDEPAQNQKWTPPLAGCVDATWCVEPFASAATVGASAICPGFEWGTTQYSESGDGGATGSGAEDTSTSGEPETGDN